MGAVVRHRVGLLAAPALRWEALASALAGEGHEVCGPSPSAGRWTAPVDVVLVDGEQDARLLAGTLEAVAVAYPEATQFVVTTTTASPQAATAVRLGAEVLLLADGVAEVVAAIGGSSRRRRRTTVPAQRPASAGLTAREVEVLQLLAAGKRNDDVAADLAISPHTVRSHLQSIHAKLGVNTRLAAVAAARRAGMLASREPAW